MKASMTRELVYTLEVNGAKFPGMRVASRWNGLTELRDEKGQILIVSGEDSGFAGALATIFNDVFRTPLETQVAGVVIVMGSPDLMTKVRQVPDVPMPAPGV